MAAVNKDAVLKSAEKLVQKGKIDAAIKEYKKVLKKTGEDPNTLNRIGDLYARLRKNDEAIHHYSQTAGSYANDGFYVKAIAVHKKSLRLEPGRLDIHQKLAELYHRQGLIPDARSHYQHLADYHQRQSDSTSAIAIYQKMIELEPENPSPRVKLADLYKQQKLFAKAIGEYGAIASLMLEHQQVEQAAQVYQRALDLDASNLEFVREALGKLLETGAAAAAQSLLAAAIQRNPGAEELRSVLAGGAPPPAAAASGDVSGTGPQAQVAPPPAPADLSGTGPQAPVVPPPATPDVTGTGPQAPVVPPAATPDVSGTGPQAPVAPPAASPDLSGTGPQAPLVPPPASPDVTGTGAQAPVVPPPASPDLSGTASQASVVPPSTPSEVSGTGPQIPPQPPTVPLGEAIPAEPPGSETLVPPTADSPSAAPPETSAAAGGEADFEEFVLDLDEEMPPPTLVEPPSDMPPGAGTGFQQQPGDTGEVELGGPGPAAAGQEFTFQPEPELNQPTLSPEDLDLELTESQLQPSIAPSADEGAAGTGAPGEASAAVPIAESGVQAEPAADPGRPVDDLLAEAEVFVKYGLSEKAIDRLREVLSHRPDHLGAYAQLIPLLLEQGAHEEIGGLAAKMASAARQAAKPEPWLELQQMLIGVGYEFSGDSVVGLPGGAPGPAASAAPPVPPVPTAPAAPALGGAATPEPPPPSPPPAPDLPAAEASTPSVEPAPAPPEISTEIEIEGMQTEIASPSLPLEPGPASGMETVVLRPGALSLPELGQQPLPPPTPQVPPTSTGSDLESESPPGPAATDWLKATSGGGELFDDEEQFFDLEAELQDDLQEPQAAAAGEEPREQTLEEIVEGFKKGVAENLSLEDSDTHYNLGIAYREMMLVDEAIGEFQIAAKDPRYLVDCCAMLGQCFTDKGLPELALKWYTKALESPEMEEDRTLGLLYDVGNLHMSMNDRDAAYRVFLEIYGINTNYRDVAAKMQQLQPSGAS